MTGSTPGRRARHLRRLGLLILSIVCFRIIIDLVGAIDWDTVVESLTHLEAWQLAVLVGVVCVRQVLNAVPLAIFIEGLSVLRATASDQGATLMSMIAPPPTYQVFRVVVLKSWGIPVETAAAGSTCNVLVFYIARWISPVLGVLLLAGVRFHAVHGLTAAGGLLIAAAILVGTLMVTSSEALARRLGAWAGSVIARLRPSVDPQGWATSAAVFQDSIAVRFREGLVLSLPVLLVNLFVDAGVLLLAIRFVGIDQDALSWIEVVAAFLIAYPLTLFPLQGVGVLDATIVAELTALGGVHLEAAILAAMITYRVVTLGTPAALGAGFIVGWRYTQRGVETRPSAEG